MKKIFKYEIRPETIRGAAVVRMPAGARVLHVGAQLDSICLWAEVDPDDPLVDLLFEVYATGAALIEPRQLLEHMGTAFIGPFVWHVYQRICD